MCRREREGGDSSLPIVSIHQTLLDPFDLHINKKASMEEDKEIDGKGKSSARINTEAQVEPNLICCIIDGSRFLWRHRLIICFVRSALDLLQHSDRNAPIKTTFKYLLQTV